MISHICENGQIVTYPTAESARVEDGWRRFYDIHGEEVGSQPSAAEPEVESELPPPPIEPPVVLAEIPSEDPT